MRNPARNRPIFYREIPFNPIDNGYMIAKNITLSEKIPMRSIFVIGVIALFHYGNVFGQTPQPAATPPPADEMMS